jgi:hypothetical protein
MNDSRTSNKFESDLDTVRRAAHSQRGRIIRSRLVETDRWDFEDLVTASDRLREPAEKYHRIAPILERLLPRLEEVCFSDIGVTEDIASLRELTISDEQTGQNQASLL